MYLFNGVTANEVWQDAAVCLLEDQDLAVQVSRNGDTKELLHAAFSIKDPTQRWIISRSPALSPAFALVEVIWILNGRNDAQFLNFFNRELPKYAGRGERYAGAYGYRLRHQFNVDQLERAYQALSSNPDSRQVVLQIWDSRADFPQEDGSPATQDVPCNVNSFLKIRDEKLIWTQMLRSNDLYRGVPYNFVQFTTLQEVIAGWLGIEVGEYLHYSDSLHIYVDDLSLEFLERSVAARSNTDTLCLRKEDSDRVFNGLGRFVDEVSTKSNKIKVARDFLNSGDFPKAYTNIVRLIADEAIRRSDEAKFNDSLMQECTNPALCQVWQKWLNRFDGPE